MPITKLQNQIQAAQFRIKFKDVFDLKDFYTMLHFLVLENGWSSVDSEGNIEEGQEHFETNYIERIDAGGTKNQGWWWRLQKLPTDNSYYKYHLDLDFITLNLVPTEVMRDGKKFKVFKGTIEFWGYAYIEFDVGGKWSKHPFLKHLTRIFPNRIFKKDLYEHHKLELYRETYTLQAWIKKWFKLKSFLPYEEITPFHPPRAHPAWKKE